MLVRGFWQANPFEFPCLEFDNRAHLIFIKTLNSLQGMEPWGDFMSTQIPTGSPLMPGKPLPGQPVMAAPVAQARPVIANPVPGVPVPAIPAAAVAPTGH